MAETVTGLLQQAMDRAVERREVAGVCLLVQQHGEERWYVESGMRNVERNESMSRDTIFRLYSQSKPVTGTAAMMLVERGLLDLGEPVSAYLPGFRGQRVTVRYMDEIASDIPTEAAGEGGLLPGDGERSVPVRREATIKDLLTMTAGLVYPESNHEAGRFAGVLFDELDARLYGDRPMTTVEFANRMGQCPLAFQPGEHFKYGTCADVLGAVIEVASGRRFGDFLREELFEPLGMTDTGFHVPADRQHRLAAIYDKPDNPMVEEHRGTLQSIVTDHLGLPYAASEPPAFESGGAGLRSTVDDFARFGRMLLNGGELDGVRVMQPRTIDMMTRNALFPEQILDYRDWQPGCDYNTFMRVVEEPGKALMLAGRGEYGWDGWLGTYFSNDPTTDSTFLLMMQLTNAGTIPLTRKLKNIVRTHLD